MRAFLYSLLHAREFSACAGMTSKLSFIILSKNFLTPFTPAVDRATSLPNGPINISYVRNASVQNSAMTSSGLMTFHRLLDILRPSSANTSQTPTNFLNGSSVDTTPISWSERHWHQKVPYAKNVHRSNVYTHVPSLRRRDRLVIDIVLCLD